MPAFFIILLVVSVTPKAFAGWPWPWYVYSEDKQTVVTDKLQASVDILNSQDSRVTDKLIALRHVHAIGRTSPDVVKALIQASVNQENSDPELRAGSVMLLNKWGRNSAAVISALIQCAEHDPEIEVRDLAYQGLIALGDTRRADVRLQLLRAIQSEEPALRLAVINSFDQLSGFGEAREFKVKVFEALIGNIEGTKLWKEMIAEASAKKLAAFVDMFEGVVQDAKISASYAKHSEEIPILVERLENIEPLSEPVRLAIDRFLAKSAPVTETDE